MPFRQGAKVAGAARKTFASNKSTHGFFGAVGAIGRKNASTMSTEQLARSGKMRAAAVAGGAMGVGAIRNRRGPGTSPTQGRPTGIRNY
jgi:hypothetical protein